MMTTYREDIPFFSDLPAAAEAPAARLWDAARSPEYNGATAYSMFIEELGARKVDLPARGLVKRWVAGVQGGLIKRPGGNPPAAAPVRKVREKKAPEVAKTELVDVIVTDDESGDQVRPTITTTMDPETRQIDYSLEVNVQDRLPVLQEPTPVSFVQLTADEAFSQLRDRMVEEALQSILQDAQAKARRSVASRLREMADQLEGASSTGGLSKQEVVDVIDRQFLGLPR